MDMLFILKEVEKKYNISLADTEFSITNSNQDVLNIEGNVVKVKLIGVCSACKNASMTLKNFVEAELKEKVDNKIIVEQV